jgi:hypothetical protein
VIAASFRDRVVHHALCNVIESIFEREFIPNSYANRKRKGTHRAVDRLLAFSQTLRQLRDLRRYSTPITINNPQQVNIAADGGQQLNSVPLGSGILLANSVSAV